MVFPWTQFNCSDERYLMSKIFAKSLWKEQRSTSTYRPPAGNAATDSRLPRPNTDNGTFDIVTTECRRPDGCGACDNVARNSASF